MKLHNVSSKNLISDGIESRGRVSSALGFESSCKCQYPELNKFHRNYERLKIHGHAISKQAWLET